MNWKSMGGKAAIAGLAMIGTSALAQTSTSAGDYPTKPIRMIIGFPPGASSDIVGRLIGQKLSEYIGQPVVVENRPGVGGNLGIASVAKSAPDGYSMVIATASIAVSASLYKNPGYDAQKDLTPIARLASIPNILIVHPSVPAKTLGEFIELARKNPGKLNFGSGGAGTTNHLANELLMHLTHIKMVHVPYKGVTRAATAMVSGEVDEVVMPVSTALPFIRSGKLRPLAVLTEERIDTLPDLPTAEEAGVKGFVMPLWYGMFGPAGLPAPILDKLSNALIRTLKSEQVRTALAKLNVEPWPGTSAELGSLLKTDIVRYGTVVQAAGLPKQ